MNENVNCECRHDREWEVHIMKVRWNSSSDEPIIKAILYFCAVQIFLLTICTDRAKAEQNEVVIKPKEYPHALRNPLKGFRSKRASHEYVTLAITVIPWNEIENEESDGIEKIRDYCNRRWTLENLREISPRVSTTPQKGIAELNIKVIPRVYLHWSGEKKFWPKDIQTDDYSSDQFKRRAVRLIRRLGILWDHDPRVAFIEMGLIGKWGEQHSPSIPKPMQKLLGDAFTEVFKNKLVQIRYPWDFLVYKFGVHWDSWAHVGEMNSHRNGIERLGDRWKTAPIGGETAYNWGNYRVQPGDGPNDTLKDPAHRDFLINTMRQLHCNHLGWVANYDQNDPDVRKGAEDVQKVLGYRFIIDEVRYPLQITSGKKFNVSFTVRNTGSAPFYYNWPVEICLLDAENKEPIWKDTFRNTDIRSWLPGYSWHPARNHYRVKPKPYYVEGVFDLPEDLADGKYILCLAILDPAGMLPSARFAIRNYFHGGRHPVGYIGAALVIENPELDEKEFDDPYRDRSLYYVLTK